MKFCELFVTKHKNAVLVKDWYLKKQYSNES